MKLFVDSAAHIALLDPQDQHHDRAISFLPGLTRQKLLTSTFVLGEVATRGSRLVGAGRTAAYLRNVFSNPIYHVVDINRVLVEAALDVLVKYEDQRLSLTDCTSLLIMRTGRIRRIFTFDDGFRRIGLETVP